jgi:hypothetical protein
MKRLVFTRLALISGFLLFIFSFSLAHAQVPSSIDGIDITTTPANPAPGANVEISVQDYLSDITSAYITWVVGGKKITEGVGKSDVNLTAPALGKTENVVILIHTEDGKDIQKSVTIQSGAVDMIYESQGYVPPLYPGKQDFAYENTVKIVAMPHLADSSGKELDPSTFLYNWKQDSTVMQSASGYGKSSIEITGSVIPRATTIDVSVSTRDGSQTATGEIVLQPGSPSVVFYKDDPLYGVLYNAALGMQTVFTDPEITLLAAPFSFTMPAPGQNSLQYAWTINGTGQDNLSSNRSVTLRVPDTRTDGTYPVDLQLQNTDQILQGATGDINVLFKAGKNNNANASL